VSAPVTEQASERRRWFPDTMPMPAANSETIGWWEEAARHRLVFQRCISCAQFRHPPGPVCPQCRSSEARWEEVAGDGVVFTYTVVRQAFVSALADRLPYVVAAIDLDGAAGVRLVSNLVDVDPAEVQIGSRVKLVWEDMGPALAVPRFRPARESDRARATGTAR